MKACTTRIKKKNSTWPFIQIRFSIIRNDNDVNKEKKTKTITILINALFPHQMK